MQAFIQNIDLIENYINGNLNSQEENEFKNRLESDPEFHRTFQEHQNLIAGIERVDLKQDLQRARTSYTNGKWLKLGTIGVAAIAIIVVVIYMFLNKPLRERPPVPNSSPVYIESDSIKGIEQDTTTYNTTTNKSKIGDTLVTTTIVETKEYAQTDLSSPSLKKAAQVFRINADKDTTLICREGTVLKIRSNSFVDKSSGQSVSGTIDLKVTEYYKVSDILLANLSTTSNGEPLETGGMLNLEAESKGIELTLKKGSSMDIQFPMKYNKNGMQLFTGQWQNRLINWNLAEPLTEEKPLSIEFEEEDIEVPFAVIEQVPTYPGCESDSNAEMKACMSKSISDFVSKRFNLGIAARLNITGRQIIKVIFKIDRNGELTDINARARHSLLSDEAIRVVSLLPRFAPGKQRGKSVTVPYSMPIIFDLSRNDISTGNFESTAIPMDSVFTTLRGKVELIREVMHDADYKVDSTLIKKWQQYEKQKLIRIYGTNSERTVQIRKALFESDSTFFVQLEGDRITRGGHIVRKLWDSIKVPTTTKILKLVPKRQVYINGKVMDSAIFETALENDNNDNIKARDVSKYMFSSSTLGWINCDRFRNSGINTTSYNLVVNDSEGTDINMVYKSFNTILPSKKKGTRFDFGLVGKDQDVILVAIKKDKGKLFYDIKETTTIVRQKVEIELKEVSVSELKSQLQRLDKIFD